MNNQTLVLRTYALEIHARFRNKRERTELREPHIMSHRADGITFSHKETGVLKVMFSRAATNSEVVIRDAADQMLAVLPDAILFELYAPGLERMAVRRAMLNYTMPWRFLDQGLHELGDSYLARTA